MLSADHYALENRAVQQLIELRHREVNYLTDRFNSIGTQSSLIAGFCVSVLSCKAKRVESRCHGGAPVPVRAASGLCGSRRRDMRRLLPRANVRPCGR